MQQSLTFYQNYTLEKYRDTDASFYCKFALTENFEINIIHKQS